MRRGNSNVGCNVSSTGLHPITNGLTGSVAAQLHAMGPLRAEPMCIHKQLSQGSSTVVGRPPRGACSEAKRELLACPGSLPRV